MLCQAAAPPLTNLFVDTAAAAAAAIQTVAQQPAAFMAPADQQPLVSVPVPRRGQGTLTLESPTTVNNHCDAFMIHTSYSI